MRTANIAVGVVAMSGLWIHAQDLRSLSPVDTPAVAAWNRMVAAKGGRERLHSVQTFRATLRQKVGRFTRYPGLISKHTEKIFALPDRLWEWYDFRPEPIPTDQPGHHFDARLQNTTDCWKWSSVNGGRADYHTHLNNCFLPRAYREQLMLYLLETRDFQPVPLRVTSGGRNRERVEVKAPDFESVTYLVDTKTSLPIEVLVIPLLKRTWDGGSEIVKGHPLLHTLGPHLEVSGIMMPTKVDGADVNSEINLAVDPRLFTTPPDGVADADAWRDPTRTRTPSPARIVGTFRDPLFGYSLDLPRGYWATDVVDQQGFRIVSTWNNTVLLMSVHWLPSGTLFDAADRWIVETRARFPNLRENSRNRVQLGGLDAIEVTMAAPDESADVNYARVVIAHRKEPGQNASYRDHTSSGNPARARRGSVSQCRPVVQGKQVTSASLSTGPPDPFGPWDLRTLRTLPNFPPACFRNEHPEHSRHEIRARRHHERRGKSARIRQSADHPRRRRARHPADVVGEPLRRSAH